MRLYEIVYIFDAALDEDSVNKKLETFHALVLGSDGEVVQVDCSRSLSYYGSMAPQSNTVNFAQCLFSQ